MGGDDWLPKAVTYSELSQGQRDVGRPRLHSLYCIKRHLKAFGVDVQKCEEKSKDRHAWFVSVQPGSSAVEVTRAVEVDARIYRRLERARGAPPVDHSPPVFACHHCGRGVSSRIGLVSSK